MWCFTLRLQPGDDIKLHLDAEVRRRALGAVFVISAAGSLRQAALRYAGKPAPTVTVADLEILGLQGTLGSDAGSHLHASLADESGTCLGGHVAEGCIVRTTAEVVLGVSSAEHYRRDLDPVTGFRELVVEDLPVE